MIEWLAGLDRTLFYAVNHGWASSVGDRFFVYITLEKNYLVPGLLLFAVLVMKGGLKGRRLVLSLLLSILVTDQLTSHVIKPLVQRPRPCQVLSDVRTPAGCGPAYSFPSSHAANSAGLMTLLALSYPVWTPVAASIALAVGLSRVYVGVHYPSDVLGGFLLGFLCALGIWRLKIWAEIRWDENRKKSPRVRKRK